MSELLIELQGEELPAEMQIGMSDKFKALFIKAFQDYLLDVNELNIYVSPRKIVIYINGLPEIIAKEATEIKGPKTSANPAAIEGFCRTTAITPSQLEKNIYNNSEHVIYNMPATTYATSAKLIEIIPLVLSSYPWPKSMFWGEHDLKWGRPLRNILALYNGEILPLTFHHLKANNLSLPHRAVSTIPFEIKNWKDYQQKMLEGKVIIDWNERRKMILQQLKIVTSANNLILREDDQLLDEVTGLVEYPTVLMGNIKTEFLKLPSEVLITSMKSHQKYFTVFDKSGKMAPYFLFACNNNPQDPESVIKGNEKVLAARLSDAVYFYSNDIKFSLESRRILLRTMIFHAKLGNLNDKSNRLLKIAKVMAPHDHNLHAAAKICKCDLTTEMVNEFPELQGVMGYYYALNDGHTSDVALMVRDYYKPISSEDIVPTANAATLSIIDKADSLVGLMLAGERATSSKDPYALRRLALGIIRTILINKIDLNIRNLIELVITEYQYVDTSPDIIDEILDFIEERYKFYLSKTFDRALINGLVSLKTNDNLAQNFQTIASLTEYLQTSEGIAILETFRRLENILAGYSPKPVILPDYQPNKYELNLRAALDIVSNNHYIHLTDQLHNLVPLTLPIAEFFDNVLVNDEVTEIANMRLLLLFKVREIMNNVINFSDLL